MPCRLVIWGVDTVHPKDANIDAQQFKRGDVITVLRYEQGLGKKGSQDPRFLAVDVDDMTVEEASAQFLASEPGFADPENASLNARPRAFKFDIDALSAGVKTALTRVPKQAEQVLLSRTDVLAVKTEKVPLEDPLVFDDPMVL